MKYSSLFLSQLKSSWYTNLAEPSVPAATTTPIIASPDPSTRVNIGGSEAGDVEELEYPNDSGDEDEDEAEGEVMESRFTKV